MKTLSLVTGALLVSGPLVAQAPMDSVVAWTSLSQRPRLLDSARAGGIRYPDMLRSSNVGGIVELETVINQDGHVESKRTGAITSTHPMFETAVKYAMPRWKLTAPVLDGMPVSANVHVRVVFELSEDLYIPRDTVASFDIDSTGIRIALGWRAVPRTVGLATSRGDSVAARVAIVIALANVRLYAGPQPPACFRWDKPKDNVPRDVFAAVSAKAPSVHNVDSCPRTYTSMFGNVDAQGRPIKPPTGHIDPVWIGVSDLQHWAEDIFAAKAGTSQGTESIEYACDARRTPGSGEWLAACWELRRLIH